MVSIYRIIQHILCYLIIQCFLVYLRVTKDVKRKNTIKTRRDATHQIVKRKYSSPLLLVYQPQSLLMQNIRESKSVWSSRLSFTQRKWRWSKRMFNTCTLHAQRSKLPMAYTSSITITSVPLEDASWKGPV